MNNEKILILDFGGHFSQLVARKVRECSVYCEVEPSTYNLENIKKYNPKGIILIGGENSTTELHDEKIIELKYPILGICHGAKLLNKYGNSNLYKIDSHPSILENQDGFEQLKNFIFNICKCKGDWKIKDFIDLTISSIKEKVKDGKVLCALSGGVDSSVSAVLLSKAVGKQLTCVFVDHGLMRKNEAEEVENIFGKNGEYDLNFIKVYARQRFYQKLKGITDPEQKRKIIGEEFIRVFEEEAKKIGSVDFLVQGTIYPDIIESGLGKDGVIKSHHNVGGLPSVVDFKEIIEPLKLLFKDEVRKVGLELGLPEYLVYRQPFPGPGLGVRIIGEITEEKVKIVQDADFIYREEIEKAGLNKEFSQYFAALTNLRSVGIKNGKRTYDSAIALRAVITSDFMNAKCGKIPYDVLEIIVNRIVTEVEGVNRVLYDFTPKPPSTIEFE